MRGVRIIFRNFRGEKSKFNQEGKRSFGVVLPPDLAEAMAEDGWPVKTLDPREDDEDQIVTPWLPIAVEYDKGRPPRITLITSRGSTPLDSSNVGQLDQVDITNVDLIVNPSYWEVTGRSGIKAYAKTMFVTIDEDELEREYAEKMAQTP